MIGLGDKVKDIVTGFTGIVTGKADYLGGCKRVQVANKKHISGIWFDEGLVKLVKKQVVIEITLTPTKSPKRIQSALGGSREDATQQIAM